MESISRQVEIEISAESAFNKFVHDVNNWWPKEYTWSQNKLVKISIDARNGGLCTEIGPNGFRCDWGSVTKISTNKLIQLKWQIGPKREPVPDREKASDIAIEFSENGNSTTAEIRTL